MRNLTTAAVGVGVIAASAFAFAMDRSHLNAERTKHMGPKTAVLVELFTSEGCSSCPPADKLLAELQKSQPADGALIIPLSEHVDYWDGPQWRDPFSSPAFSARQGNYVRTLKLESSYTPQMVVDGHAEFVGSDEGAALASIAKAAKTPKAQIDVTTDTAQPDRIGVGIGVRSIKSEGTNDVFVAVTENNLASKVRGGENGGRQLRHTAVVRSLQRVGSINGAAPFDYNGAVHLNPAWKKKDLAVVVFIQSRSTLRVLGSALANL